MLQELFIRNFAIIDELRLTFDHGFNVLTGETGAGKSIILDAVMLILGERGDRSMVRAGKKSAVIEATFALDEARRVTVGPVLAAEDLEGDSDDELVIIREVKANGGTVARINGARVTAKLLQQVGASLIDIHGQGSHLNLLRPKSHLPLLDSYATVVPEQQALAAVVSELRVLQRELDELQQDDRLLAQKIDILTFQVSEIDAATLRVGEEVELKTERKRLASAEQLMQHSAEVGSLLRGSDDETPAAVDLLNQVERALTQLARLDDSKNELLETMQGLLFQVEEVASEIVDYQDSLEFNPSRLNEVEERLELISRLKRKYGESIEAILAHRDRSSAELDRIESSGDRIEELQVEIKKYLVKIGKLGQSLSNKRQASAKTLAESVETELGDLRMTARFAVDFQHVDEPNGAVVGERQLAFDHTGFDRVEFLLSTNPGEPLKPMARVASGGETARIMLALKTALAQVDDTPTLIFDEIDQGIGGRIGDTVGRKLWGLTAVGDHQVIVVTHLPQLAGYGDRHFHVRKGVRDGRTRTRVSELDYETRVTELAAMIGTDATHSRGGAASILNNAASIKAARRGG